MKSAIKVCNINKELTLLNSRKRWNCNKYWTLCDLLTIVLINILFCSHKFISYLSRHILLSNSRICLSASCLRAIGHTDRCVPASHSNIAYVTYSLRHLCNGLYATSLVSDYCINLKHAWHICLLIPQGLKAMLLLVPSD